MQVNLALKYRACWKGIFLTLTLVCFHIGTQAQSYYPYLYNFSYGSVQDSIGNNFSGTTGMVAPTVWKDFMPAFNDPRSNRMMSGFRPDLIYVENAFDAELFASKAYFGDYVELRWDLANYASQVTSFRIYRKEVGSTADSVQIANLAPTERTWQDHYADAGTMYQYTLLAEGIYNLPRRLLNLIQGVGFRIPYGRVSGRVTYEGGAAVEGVTLIAETQDNFGGSSIYLNSVDSSYLQIPDNPLTDNFDFESAMTFQIWFKPDTSKSFGTIFQKGDQYKLTYEEGADSTYIDSVIRYVVRYNSGGTPVTDTLNSYVPGGDTTLLEPINIAVQKTEPTGKIKFMVGATTLELSYVRNPQEWVNITAMRSDSALKIYAIYDRLEYQYTSIPFTASTPSNDSIIRIGKSASGEYLHAFVDEIRIWSRTFQNDELLDLTSRFIEGTESGLEAYYRLDEGIGNYFYDFSRAGFTFNENHGLLLGKNINWDTSGEVPNKRQLAVRGLTDASGNYIISGIPYATTGSIYKIVPSFGVHTFNPGDQILFIGPGAAIHNNINFLDIASFALTGQVYYKNTFFPVEGVAFRIDGELALNSNGTLITTNSLGEFLLDVPIGLHTISAEKFGHTILYQGQQRFPTDSTKYNFQGPFKIDSVFWDFTTVKVIGKVAGGPVEAAKPKGLGRTKNNIGQASIILSTQKGYDLSDKSNGKSKDYISKYYRADSLADSDDTTSVFISGTNPTDIIIQPDGSSGEYTAMLLPEKYVITGVTAGAGDYIFPSSFHTTLDLTNSFEVLTEIDSVQLDTPIVFSSAGEIIPQFRVDSVHYQKNYDFIYRTIPDVSLTAMNGDAAFWEKEITATDDSLLVVVDTADVPLTPYPILLQRELYQLKIKVFESYYNEDSSVVDEVPVSDGTVTIDNALAIDNVPKTIAINEKGEIDYQFQAGLPNILGDKTHSMNVTAYTGKNGSISTAWDYTHKNGTKGPFKAYIFGSMPTGNNFVTTGPSSVDMILRDPYGSGSYAWFDQGKSVTKTQSLNIATGISGNVGTSHSFGTTITTFIGLGAGTITSTTTTNDLDVGIQHSDTWVNNNTISSTTTATQTWSTSSSPFFVGTAGDVFIGHSTNIVYGIARNLGLIDTNICTNCDNHGVGGYQIGLENVLRVNPEFGTGFQYTQYHIENNLIPNLKNIRDIYLSKTGQYYTSHETFGSPDYGRPNSPDSITTSVFWNPALGDSIEKIYGNSYDLEYPQSVFADTSLHPYGFVDSVAYYNSQIIDWTEILKDNEEEKVNSTLIQNLSFDAGVTYTNTTTYNSSKTKTKSFEWSIARSVASKVGVTVLGVGMIANLQNTISNNGTKLDGTETTENVSFGYQLADSDAGDYLSVDVKDPGSQYGPVFANRGGQTKCPYNGQEVTKYYNPGTLLSQATLRREIPQISTSNSVINNVPEDQIAQFQVDLGNIAQSNDASWFSITAFDDTAAIVSMNGSVLGSGQLIKVPAGGSVKRVIGIEQGLAGVYNYTVGIVMSSDCEAGIADTLYLTATFTPVCSKVELGEINDKWVINTNSNPPNILSSKLQDYDLQHPSFTRLAFQYKPTASGSWFTDKIFLVDTISSDDSIAYQNGAVLINNRGNVPYSFDMSSLQDRNYDVRAISTCADGTVHESSVFTGIKDTKRPRVFGTPQPGDGILSPGEDIMISFDETIEEGLLLPLKNFSVRGVLNGSPLGHDRALFFDGVDDYASVVSPSDLDNRSFSIEFWTKRQSHQGGVIMSKGDLRIGFNNADELYVRLGSDSVNTSTTYDTLEWSHFTITFDAASQNLTVYSAFGTYGDIEISDRYVSNPFTTSGRIQIGKADGQGDYYHGLIHDFRIWEKVIGQGTAVSQRNLSLTGDELKLAGFWPMNELRGDLARDLARSHHAILHGASWRAMPSGYAVNFNGGSNLLIPTASNFVITDEMDFSIEMWFKGDPSQNNTILFSSGRVDTAVSGVDFGKYWNVGFNANGQIYARNSGVSITDGSNQNLLDNEWHHMALVMRRRSNTALYIDGTQVALANSAGFGPMSNDTMSLGSDIGTPGANQYQNYFTGSIDEFRGWRLARTQELIKSNMHNKLSGSERGLSIYYPFEKYNLSISSTPVSSLEDQDYKDDSLNVSLGLAAQSNGVIFENGDIPNIADVRPEQGLAFGFVTNNDKIIININEPPAAIERQVLTFTVDRVEDLRANRMASPVTWTAFVRQNTVIWGQEELHFTKKQYDTLSFGVEVQNIGGLPQNYSITNLPGWLTVSSGGSGSIGPASTTELTFDVDPSLNIGTYEEVIYLVSPFGYNEPLHITVKVEGTSPNWSVNPNNYQHSMNIIGRIKVDGIVSTDEDDMLVAMVNDTVRGIANLQYFPAYDAYLVFMDVYSNLAGGEMIDFVVWDASNGKVHTEVTPTLLFQSNSLQGSPLVPVDFEAINTYYEPIDVSQGWNWISFHLDSKGQDTTNVLLQSLSPQDGDILKGISNYDQYSSATGWSGTITANGGVQATDMYKLKISGDDTIDYVGSKIDPGLHPIPIDSGWNWIGFISQNNMTVNNAFSFYNAAHGDLLKGQLSFVVYDSILGWVGNLGFLQPKHGYMYLSHKSDTLRYPDSDLFNYKNAFDQDQVYLNNLLTLDEHAYRYSMNIIATAPLCEEAPEGSYLLLAYESDEIRGVSRSHNKTFFTTLYGDGILENLRFEIVNELGQRFELDESIQFTPEGLRGSINKPVYFSTSDPKIYDCDSYKTMAQLDESGVAVFPTAFSDRLEIRLSMPQDGEVNIELYDVAGRHVTSIINGFYEKGQHQVNWKANASQQSIAAGIYMVHVSRGNELPVIQRVVKLDK